MQYFEKQRYLNENKSSKTYNAIMQSEIDVRLKDILLDELALRFLSRVFNFVSSFTSSIHGDSLVIFFEESIKEKREREGKKRH